MASALPVSSGRCTTSGAADKLGVTTSPLAPPPQQHDSDDIVPRLEIEQHDKSQYGMRHKDALFARVQRVGEETAAKNGQHIDRNQAGNPEPGFVAGVRPSSGHWLILLIIPRHQS
jgi:hypothetical protein